MKNNLSFLLFCGTHDELRKGFSLAVEALRLFNEENLERQFHIHVIGDANLQIKNQLNFIKNINFYGKINNQDKINSIIKKSSFLLQSSYEDNWSNVLVEASALGCIPLVLPNHGNEEFCTLFNLRDFVSARASPMAYFDLLSKAASIDDDEYYKVSNQLSQNVLHTHAYSIINKEFEDLLNSIISGGVVGAAYPARLTGRRPIDSSGLICDASEISVWFNNLKYQSPVDDLVIIVEVLNQIPGCCYRDLSCIKIIEFKEGRQCELTPCFIDPEQASFKINKNNYYGLIFLNDGHYGIPNFKLSVKY
jgi:hypothetical protein